MRQLDEERQREEIPLELAEPAHVRARELAREWRFREALAKVEGLEGIEERAQWTRLAQLYERGQDSADDARAFVRAIVEAERDSTVQKFLARDADSIVGRMMGATPTATLTDRCFTYLSRHDELRTAMNDVLVAVKVDVDERRLQPFGSLLQQGIESALLNAGVATSPDGAWVVTLPLTSRMGKENWTYEGTLTLQPPRGPALGTERVGVAMLPHASDFAARSLLLDERDGRAKQVAPFAARRIKAMILLALAR
jgi:hypothetical protein